MAQEFLRVAPIGRVVALVLQWLLIPVPPVALDRHERLPERGAPVQLVRGPDVELEETFLGRGADREGMPLLVEVIALERDVLAGRVGKYLYRSPTLTSDTFAAP